MRPKDRIGSNLGFLVTRSQLRTVFFPRQSEDGAEGTDLGT